MRRVCLLALLLVAACVTPRPMRDRFAASDITEPLERIAATGAPGERVQLAFAPGDDFEALVLSELNRTRPGEVERARVAHRARLRKVKDGWTLTASDAVEVDERGVVVRRLEGADVVQRIAADGSFRAIDRIERVVGALPGVTAESTSQLARVAVIRLAEEWTAMVSFWAGATLRIGATYEVRQRIPSESGTAEVTAQFSLDGRVPCTPGTFETRCVRLRMRSTPDTAAITGLRETLAADLNVADEAVLEASVSDEMTLVTEPETLVPHRWSHRRTTRLTVKDGESRRVLGGEQLRVRAFEYLDE